MYIGLNEYMGTIKLAIMQPYFFPYIGYWQLINSVDKFIFLDNVNYKKKGYINRNRINLNGTPHTITLPIKSASQNKFISEIEIHEARLKLLKTIYHAYSKAPLFTVVYPLLEQQILLDTKSLSVLLINSIVKISKYLQIETNFKKASELNISKNLKGQDRIISICKYFNSTQYINLPGGRNLYEKDIFKMNNIEIFFLEPNLKKINYFSNTNESYLSIIDLLMNKEFPIIKNYLNNFNLHP